MMLNDWSQKDKTELLRGKLSSTVSEAVKRSQKFQIYLQGTLGGFCDKGFT